jgi:hypothetical protein
MNRKVKISVAVEEEIHKQLKYRSFDQNVTVQEIVEIALKRYFAPEESSGHSVEESKRAVHHAVKKLLAEGDPLIIESLEVTVRAIERMSHVGEPATPIAEAKTNEVATAKNKAELKTSAA